MTPEFIAMSLAMRAADGNRYTVGEALLGGAVAIVVLFVLYLLIGFVGVIVQDVGWWLRHVRWRKK